MNETNNWLKENVIDHKGKIPSDFTFNNGQKIHKLNSKIHQNIFLLTNHLESEFQDITFIKRLHFILQDLSKIKKWIRLESFYFNNLQLWVEYELLDRDRKLKQAFLREDCIRIKNRFPTLYEMTLELTSFLNEDVCFIQRLWHIYNDVYEIPLCDYCGENFTGFYGFQKGYNRFCCNSCINLGTEEKRKSTKLEKYGDENYNNKQKSIVTYFKRTGYHNPQQNPEIKKQTKQTKFKRYGDENYVNPKKAKQTKREKYGNENFCNYEKASETYFKRTGYKSTLANPEVRQKAENYYLENFGVRHNMHIGSVAERCKGGYKNSWHDYTLPSGKIIKLQGFEPKGLDLLLQEYDESEILYRRGDMPRIFYEDSEGKSKRYYPDFYIPKDNLIIEVKSTYTYEVDLKRNLLKKKTTTDLGFDFKFLIL